jgi:hypothetical protein
MLICATGARLPGRVIERRANSLTVAIVVPVGALGPRELDGMAVEYANPCGRVRFAGVMRTSAGPDCVRVQIDAPELVSVVQQRAYFRAEVERPVELETPEGRLNTYTVDLGGGGMLLAEHGALVKDEVVDFVLHAVAGAPILGRARTVRVDAEGRPALEFVTISIPDRWRLVRFTMDLQRSGRPAPAPAPPTG